MFSQQFTLVMLLVKYFLMFDLSFKLATFEGASKHFQMQKQKSPQQNLM